ncbi:hypothetical protein ABIC33_004030 [Variovorax sp. 1140]|uniref:hypothetical protein n=1 Tax=Variovorax atrisoli TaxID=3394203 RepID=UPI00339AC9F4
MAADPTPGNPAGTAPGFECLSPPRLRGWPALQARLVHNVKRAALRQLHASNDGEMLLLRFYLVGEESSEQALQRELRIAPPEWLARQLDQHLADEQLHARLFAQAIVERGGSAQAAASPEQAPRPDWFSRRKLARWQALIRRHAPHFAHGGLVPAYAIGLAAEQMASRILQRHCALIGPQHALHPLLARVMADEDRHIRLCTRTLQRCVAPHEEARLAQLMREVRDTERGFGVTGALGMWLAGVALRLRPGSAPPVRHHA